MLTEWKRECSWNWRRTVDRMEEGMLMELEKDC